MKYADFQPTGFDVKGAFLPERQDWIVAPCSRTRDSGCLDESNFESCLEILGGESDTVEVHRFGHWGPGWFELILVHPSREEEVEEIEDSLENYPVLNDDDFSRREWENQEEAWELWACGDFLRELEKKFDCEFELSDSEDSAAVRELFEKACERAHCYIEHTDEGARFPIDCAVEVIEREEVKEWISSVDV